MPAFLVGDQKPPDWHSLADGGIPKGRARIKNKECRDKSPWVVGPGSTQLRNCRLAKSLKLYLFHRLSIAYLLHLTRRKDQEVQNNGKSGSSPGRLCPSQSNQYRAFQEAWLPLLVIANASHVPLKNLLGLLPVPYAIGYRKFIVSSHHPSKRFPLATFCHPSIRPPQVAAQF